MIGPVFHDVAVSGPVPGDLVNLLSSGGTGSAFTSQTVPDAVIAPTGTTLSPAGDEHASGAGLAGAREAG